MIHKRHPDVAGSTRPPQRIQTRQVCRPLLAQPGPSVESRTRRVAARGGIQSRGTFQNGNFFSRLDDAPKVLMRSLGGFGCGLALSTWAETVLGPIHFLAILNLTYFGQSNLGQSNLGKFCVFSGFTIRVGWERRRVGGAKPRKSEGPEGWGP